jgi:hypothetical protein
MSPLYMPARPNQLRIICPKVVRHIMCLFKGLQRTSSLPFSSAQEFYIMDLEDTLSC